MSNQSSDFSNFSTRYDNLVAEANDVTMPGISFLRLEFTRVRAGMSSYLLKVSTPKSVEAPKVPVQGQAPIVSKSNTKVTLRCDRRHASADGIRATARTIIREMQLRGDTTADWTIVTEDSIVRAIASPMKFFSVNTGTNLMQFTTEAI